MKPLLIVVPRYPVRKQRCDWLETDESRAIVDVQYLDPLKLGTPVFGKGGQLYSCGAVDKAMFEAVVAAWRQAQDYKFFGFCKDDVVVETHGFLAEAMKMLIAGSAGAVGAHAREMPEIEYFRRKMDVLLRCWVAVRRLLSDVNWETLWKLYELPDWEATWMHYSKVKTQLFPEMQWNHLCPVSGDCADMSMGSVVEHYHGVRTFKGVE